jgi:antitoxin HicB
MSRYPILLEQDDNDTVLVSFPDFPEAHTFGNTKEDALARAVDALETVIEAYVKDRRPIPKATATAEEIGVDLPALVALKVELYESMREQKVSKAELARRLNVHMPQVDRLLNMKHGSKLDQLEAAARALGGRIEVHFLKKEVVSARERRSRRVPSRRAMAHKRVARAARAK